MKNGQIIAPGIILSGVEGLHSVFSANQHRLPALSSAMKGVVMDFNEKTKIRIEHWIEHNEDHLQEYESFAQELKNAGKTECAENILEAARLTARAGESLRRALKIIK